MLLDTFDASLLGNMLAGRGAIWAAEGKIRVDEETNRAGPDFECCLVLYQKYYQNETKLNLFEKWFT